MLYVFDLDGVLYRMDDPIPGAADAVRRLRTRGDRAFFLTNNSSRTRADYAEKLTRLGIEAHPDEVMTSAYATGQLLAGDGAAGKAVYVVGEQGLRAELAAAGLRVVEYDDGARIDYVVAGWDREFSYRKLTEAHWAIGRGAVFVATNRDATYPDAGGRTLPGGGSIVAAIRTCSGVEPRTVGKPEPYSLELILRQTGISREQCLVVGDRLDTDIALGRRAGTRTALVLTGVTTRAEAESAPAGLRPDLIAEDVAALV